MNQHSSEFTSLEDAKQFIASHDKDLKKIANTVIKNNGYDYAISSSFGLDDFPVENISEEDYSYISEDNTVFRFKYLTFLNKLFK